MTNDEWLTTPGQLERSQEELGSNSSPTLERVVVATIILIAAIAALFLAGVVHQIKPDFFPAIWEAVITWGGIWSRLG